MMHDGTNDTNLPADERDLDELVGEMRRSYHAPGSPPLDAMWERIERESFGARGARLLAAGRRTGQRGLWWMGLAAALVVGIGIGRLSRPASTVVARTASSHLAPRTPRPADTAYDGATARYLGQTAALLISLPAEARAGRTDRRFLARAAELLTTTRLLLDSPAAADPKVRALLEDVELVLAQVAHLESERGRVEFELITQALEQRDLLPRLTAAAASSAEADD